MSQNRRLRRRLLLAVILALLLLECRLAGPDLLLAPYTGISWQTPTAAYTASLKYHRVPSLSCAAPATGQPRKERLVTLLSWGDLKVLEWNCP